MGREGGVEDLFGEHFRVGAVENIFSVAPGVLCIFVCGVIFHIIHVYGLEFVCPVCQKPGAVVEEVHEHTPEVYAIVVL